MRTLTTLCWFGALMLVLSTSARAEITIDLDVKDGDHVSDIVKIVARVSGAEIDKVEFKVDDSEPVVSTSTPYTFTWDTIKIAEGSHKLIVTAHDTNSQTKQTSLILQVDNELGQGAAALAQKGQMAFSAKDYDAALKFSRRSLKAEPNNLAAARVAASVWASRAEWSAAVEALTGVQGINDTPDAMQQLAMYRMRFALLPENSMKFIAEVQEIDTLRRRAYDIEVEEVRKKNTPGNMKGTLENFQAIGDALVRAGRYNEARIEYAKAGLGDDVPVSLLNRRALASVLADQAADALTVLRPAILAKKADVVTRAVYGLALIRQRKFDEALKIVQQDIGEPVPATLIVASYAQTATGKRKDATMNAKEAVRMVPDAGDAHYALSIALSLSRDNDDVVLAERSLQRSLALAPFQTGPYLSHATQLLAQKRTDRFEQAMQLVNFVVKYDTNNFMARLTQAMIYLQTNRIKEAEPILVAMDKREHDAPDMRMALSAYYSILGNAGVTAKYLNDAQMIDPVRFTREQAPTPMELVLWVNRRWHYRADAFLSLTSIYPPAKP